MKSVAITDFKAKCLGLLEDVARTGEPLVITKRGKPLARVVPTAAEEARYPQQSLMGSVTILGDVIEPAVPADAWSAKKGQLLSRERSPAKRAK